MIPLQKYLDLKGIGKRAFYYQIEQKKIFKKELDGEIFVIDPEISMSDEARMTLRADANKELELLVLKANAYRPKYLPEGTKFHCKEIKQIVNEIQTKANIWRRKGVELRGWSKSACYKKIENPGLLNRKKRSDLFVCKNPQLAKPSVYESLKSLYMKLYFNNHCKKPSLRMICKKIQMKAQKTEEFYEIASIPFSTLYDNVRKINERYAHGLVHLQQNNASHFARKRAYVEGAFTADIGFMEWFAMDDHVMEVEGAWVYNEIKSIWEKKKVYLWTVIECKTLYPIAYHIMADNFNAEDIKLLMLRSLTNIGQPTKGILMDNGLASSRKCSEFLDRLGIIHDPGPAYEPMHKAVQERIFGFIKNEFCSDWSNYIGGGREEVRHTTKKLSPEECDFTVKEFIEKFDDYMEGFYQTNIRTRTDDYKKVETSIRDDFEKRYLDYLPQFIDPVKLRASFMVAKVKYFSLQHLLFGDQGVFIPDTDKILDPVLQERNYLCYYNPLDLSEIDMYAMEDILIQKTGEVIEEGQLVATLYNQRGKSAELKRKQVAVINKKNNKRLREYISDTVDLTIAENFSSFSPELNEKGQLTDTRLQLTEKASSIMYDAEYKMKQVLVPEVKRRGRKPAEEAELTSDDLESLNEVLKGGEYDN